jgi:MinD superfamily P-loop ATPase
MIVAIASGKGGTGKTTVAVNLARAMGSPVQLLDCDVEEPNDNLFLKGRVREAHTVTLPVPEVDATRCDGCGECCRFCEYHALACLGGSVLVFPELCHGCGGCTLVCPQSAIRERSRTIGVVETVECGAITLVQGRLDIGVALVPPLIRAVKAHAQPGVATIVDAPPGTSCPVIAAVTGADAVALVTEPTPFGLHDLGLAVDTLRELHIPLGVVVNRVGEGDGRVHAYCRAQGIPVLAEFPDDRRVAEAYSRGELAVDARPELGELFRGLHLGLLGLTRGRA